MYIQLMFLTRGVGEKWNTGKVHLLQLRLFGLVYLRPPPISTFVAEIGLTNCISVVPNWTPLHFELHFESKFGSFNCISIFSVSFSIASPCILRKNKMGFRDSALYEFSTKTGLNRLGFSYAQLYLSYFQSYRHTRWDAGGWFQGLSLPLRILSWNFAQSIGI